VIVVSLLLIVLSGGLLAAGISAAANGLVVTSIGVSMLAAGALFLGIRQQRDALVSGRAPAAPGPSRVPVPHAVGAAVVGTAPVAGAALAGAADDDPTMDPVAIERLDTGALYGKEFAAEAFGSAELGAARAGSGGRAGRAGVPEQTRRSERIEAPAAVLDSDDDPPGEPPAEPMLASEVSRLAQRDDEVLVVDGRPRYHLESCSHLAGHEAQPLPVSEAVELGFTGCAECAAATTLLGQPPRG
jgi:hypothetical protein